MKHEEICKEHTHCLNSFWPFSVHSWTSNCMWFTNIEVECPHPCPSLKKIMVQLQLDWSQLHFSLEANRLPRGTDPCPGQLADPFRLLPCNSDQSLTSGTDMASGIMWLTFKWLACLPNTQLNTLIHTICQGKTSAYGPPQTLPWVRQGHGRSYALPKASAWPQHCF